MGQKIEGYWDCPYCGRKANLGRYRNCPGCGKPRGSSTKFYLIETNKFVSDEVVPKGPDWYCECCDSYNTYSAEFCVSCGAPKESSKDYFEMQRKKEVKDSYNDSRYEDHLYTTSREEPKKESVKEPVKETSYTSQVVTQKKSFSKSINFNPRIVLIVLLIIASLAGIIYLCMPKEIAMDITEVSWARSIDIEEYKTVREDDWFVPEGGRVVYTRQEIHHYDSVLDHYETITEQKSETYISGYTTVTDYIDLGNGYFDTRTHQEPEYSTRYYTETRQEPVYRDEPVYRTKYYYDIERWVYARTVKSSGASNTKQSIETEGFPGEDKSIPYWPETNLGNNERQGAHSETYTITGIVTSKNKQPEKTYKVEYELWETLHPGDTIEATISFGKISEFSKVE